MKLKKEIAAIRRDLIALFGEDDAAVRALELKEKYLEIAEEFHRVREFKSYDVALQFVCSEFHISESTCKRAISFHKALVHENELKN